VKKMLETMVPMRMFPTTKLRLCRLLKGAAAPAAQRRLDAIDPQLSVDLHLGGCLLRHLDVYFMSN
jgi:hypothetical protein